MDQKLVEAIDELIMASEGEVIKVAPPDDGLIDEYESQLGIKFCDEYRFFLKNASVIFFGSIEPLILSRDRNIRGELAQAIHNARQMGVPSNWLPICEDNGDYYCIDQSGSVRFWSGNGVSAERWPTLADWIKNVWLGEN